MNGDNSGSNKKAVWIEAILVVFLSCVFVLAITVGMGPIRSGWHLVDDHQFFGYIYQFDYKKRTLWSEIIFELRRDALQQHRARFLYYPFRVIQTYLFRYNYMAYYIVKAVEGIIALSFMYYVGRELKLNRYLSALFGVLVLAGGQGAVLWKLGPQHLQSTMFMAIGLYYMMVYLRTRKRAFSVVSLISYFLMACFHESFVVTIPFLILFVIYYELRNDEGDVKISIKGIIDIIRKDLAYLVPLASIFLIIMLYIALFLGIFSYGVVKKNVPIRTILNNLKSGFMEGDFGWYFYVGIALLIILASYYEKIKPVWMELLMAASFALPQIMLYTSESFYERYLLPLTFGWSLLFVANYGRHILEGGRRWAYVILLSFLAIIQVRTTIIEADYYRFRGESVTAMLEEVLSLSENGYQVTSILGIANPEADMTMSTFLMSHGQDDCWYWNESLKEIKDTRPYVKEYGDESHPVEDVDLFVAYNRNDRHFTMDPTLDLSEFHCVKCGSLDLYFSDDAYATLTADDIDSFKIKPTIYGIGADN